MEYCVFVFNYIYKPFNPIMSVMVYLNMLNMSTISRMPSLIIIHNNESDKIGVKSSNVNCRIKVLEGGIFHFLWLSEGSYYFF
jgi:hypothetical protein